MDKGGLLEVLYKNDEIFVSYSENRGDGKSSTSVAKAPIKDKDLKFKNIFRCRTTNKFRLSLWFKISY